ncbi:MAG: hypothetical protein FJ265_02095 [Planctomycetes bacterium]|nr:hypothetical protein [Planctomycetota bacterium]
MRLHSSLSGFFLVCAATVTAQTAPPSGHWEYVRVASGPRDNLYPLEDVVWREFVATSDDVPWIRLVFDTAVLGDGSYLRIVSLADGDYQTLHREHLEQWPTSTAAQCSSSSSPARRRPRTSSRSRA